MENEAKYYEALGMEVPSETPAVATPEGAEGSQGVQAQPVAGAAGENKEAGGQAGDSPLSLRDVPPQGGGYGSPSQPEADSLLGEGAMDSSAASEKDRLEGNGAEEGAMSKEERARQAKARRERERQQAVDAAVAEVKKQRDQEMVDMLKGMGLTNRYRDNAPITTREEYLQWQADNKTAGMQERLRRGQLTPEDLQQAASTAPEVKALQEQMQQMQQQMQAQQQRQAQEQAVQQELAEIRKLDPSIKTIKDVLDLPTGAEFRRLVEERGMNFHEAFTLANHGRLVQAQQLAAQESAARSYHSKDHLRSVTPNSGTPVSLPKTTRKLYDALMPEMSEEQRRLDYARWGG